jgi:tRNA threonylcarbamoyladenosine biosynthesis protein TsaB
MNMLILAVNTATPSISVALWQDGRLAAGLTLEAGRPHAETLLPAVRQLLDQTSFAVSSVDAFACTIGPGSYTGIRIGVSAVKAMAYACNKPVVGVSTLEALVWPYAGCPGIMACPVLDARNRRVYAAAWRGGLNVLPEANWLASELIGRLLLLLDGQQPELQKILLVGRIPPETRQVIDVLALDKIIYAPAALAFPAAASVAEIAENKIRQGLTGTPFDLMPSYLSSSQAQRRFGELK